MSDTRAPNDMPLRRPAALVVLCTLLTGAIYLDAKAPADGTPAQQPAPSSDSTPVFRSSIDAIQVDVVATDKEGRPVTDLKATDFEVFENGKPQEITTFARIEMPAEATAHTFQNAETDVRSNADPEGRVYIFALDEIPADSALRARLLVRNFIEQYFGPNDVGAVVHIGQTLRTNGQDLTRSRARLLAAIDKYTGGAPPDNPVGDETVAASMEMHKRINQLESLADLVEFMLKLPAGRKAMLLISVDLSAGDETAQVDVNQVLSHPSRAKRLSDFCVQPEINRAMSCRPSQAMHRTLAAAAHSNLVIYPINPMGFTGNLRDYDLRLLAEATGGFAVANTNAFSDNFARIVLEHGNYYLLGFNSAYTGQTGRNVGLEVKSRREGVSLSARTGYMSPFREERRLFDAARGSRIAQALASPVATPGLPMQVSAAPFKGSGNKASIALVVHLDPSRIPFVESRNASSGRIELWNTATDSEGRAITGKKFTVKFALQPSTREKLAKSGLRLLAPVSLPPGRYQLRVAAGNEETNGSVVYDLDVPDFNAPFAMSGILVSSVRSTDVMTLSPADAPPIPGAAWGTPTTSRQFGRDEVVRIYGELYERAPSGANMLVMEAALRDVSGRTLISRSRQRPAGDARDGVTGGYGFGLELPLAGVPAGTYTLQVQGRSGTNRDRRIVRNLLIQVK